MCSQMNWTSSNRLPLPHNQYHLPLRSPGLSAHRLLSQYAVSQAVKAVRLVRDLCIHQHHQVVVAELHVTDFLGEAKAPAVPDVLRSEVDPWAAGRPAPQQWQLRMKAAAAIEEKVVETDQHCELCSSTDLWDPTPLKCVVFTPVRPTGARRVLVTKKMEKI